MGAGITRETRCDIMEWCDGMAIVIEYQPFTVQHTFFGNEKKQKKRFIYDSDNNNRKN